MWWTLSIHQQKRTVLSWDQRLDRDNWKCHVHLLCVILTTQTANPLFLQKALSQQGVCFFSSVGKIKSSVSLQWLLSQSKQSAGTRLKMLCLTLFLPQYVNQIQHPMESPSYLYPSFESFISSSASASFQSSELSFSFCCSHSGSSIPIFLWVSNSLQVLTQN